MYGEWASLSTLIQHGSSDNQSVLGKLPFPVSKEVAVAVVKTLVSNLGITSHPAEPSTLLTDADVQWCMQVVCYGLSLPLTEHDTIKDCVNVYCEWLSAMSPVPKVCVPQPVCADPNLYTRKMVSHLHNLFVPRKGDGVDTINRQAVLCHRVLRTLQNLAHSSSRLTRETWEALLLFLLSINDALLAPPTLKEDIGDQLCERVLSVLFELWLLACACSFPSPPLWKTLRESCMKWRHRLALVEQWNRVCLALTARLLEFTYGPSFPELRISEEDAQLIPSSMSRDCIAQSWFRMMHTLGNPVELCHPQVISQTPQFLQFAITSDTVVDPCQHQCLAILPLVFLKAIKGIASQVDAFLGNAQLPLEEQGSSTDKKDASGAPLGSTPSSSSSPTPPPQRRLAKSFSVAPSAMTKGIPKAALIGLTSSRSSTVHVPSTPNSGPPSTSSLSSLTGMGPEPRPPLAPGRPKCNSVLHMFGEWLFEAAHIGCQSAYHVKTGARPENIVKRPSSLLLDGHRGSLSLPPSSLEPADLPANLTIDKFEAGRAEAVGALCRVFCAKKTGEEITPVYLARFYLALREGLQVPEDRSCGEVLASILLNSGDLFRLDLDGVQVLVPGVICALEIVLPEKELKLKSSSVSKTELRRASIHLLLSMLALPLHYQNLPIKELVPSSAVDKPQPVTFAQMKPRLMNLLISALQVETDSLNCQMLLGGLLLSVQDSAAAEEAEQVMQPESAVGPDSTSNLLSSVSDTFSLNDFSSLLSVDSLAEDFSGICFDYPSGLIKNALECKRAVKWLCDYISYQCSRPPQCHSKDLHSSIVAAFHCAATWLAEHPYLLRDKEGLTTVLEVGKPGEPVKMKDEKDLKPASMRVRDAAEALLTVILEQVGYFPSPCGPESLSSLLDESALLRHCNSWPGGDVGTEAAIDRFRYFVLENNTLLALLEEPLGNDQDPQPTVTVLIRGPFGRHAWTLQLRHLPRHKSGTGTKPHASNPGRPVPMNEEAVRPEHKPKYFPDSVERIPKCKVDSSIPPLEAVYNDEQSREDHVRLNWFLDQQRVLEEAAAARLAPRGPASMGDPEDECTPPPVRQDLQTARLFLSHFGFLSAASVKDALETSVPPLAVMDTGISGFCTDLDSLDNMSSRTCDTVHIFYVRSRQKTVEEILEPEPEEHGGALYNGDQKVLYWSDVSAELAFVVPTLKSRHSCDTVAMFDYPQGRPVSTVGNLPTLQHQQERPSRTLSLDLGERGGPGAALAGNVGAQGRDELLRVTNTGLETVPPLRQERQDVFVVCLHALQSGLLRVRLHGPTGRSTSSLATPLVDGMVVSRRVLGNMVRQTALNLCRRRRLDNDVHHPPHVRRRLKIQELVQKYRAQMSQPQLYTHMFTHSHV
ncbi:hypothetical protein B566_EDAN008869 [Ephemera danica]|nr:hypothetical protein B566_EDAN008869 [Ephemera danica]